MMKSDFKIMIVVGTRPDALKMYPVWRELKRAAVKTIMVSTTQHTDLLNQVFKELDFYPEHVLGVMTEDQSLPDLTGKLSIALGGIVAQVSPDLILVQGDTTSSLVGALTGFYARIPVGHVEAGLRTGDPTRPFPEEINRVLISKICDYHFAPTIDAYQNLTNEGIIRDRVLLTGNTSIDTLLEVRDRDLPVKNDDLADILQAKGDIIAVTAHRRESFGKPLEELMQALVDITRAYKNVHVVYPVHPNPSVFGPVMQQLAGKDRVHLLNPLGYGDLIRLLEAASLILTDSGGIQEEAPSVGTPVVILRDKTERMETVELGFAQLVGMDRERIVRAVYEILGNRNRPTLAVNPFGDGKAGKRIAEFILNRYMGCDLTPTRMPSYAT